MTDQGAGYQGGAEVLAWMNRLAPGGDCAHCGHPLDRGRCVGCQGPRRAR